MQKYVLSEKKTMCIVHHLKLITFFKKVPRKLLKVAKIAPYMGSSRYVNFITANFVTATFQNFPNI